MNAFFMGEGPKIASVQGPASSVQPPDAIVHGAASCQFFIQGQGEYFWVFERLEDSMQVKWMRGHTRLGETNFRPTLCAMMDTGLTSINGYDFENGLYMEEQGEERALYSVNGVVGVTFSLHAQSCYKGNLCNSGKLV
jgi:hypothetical protein